MKLRVRLNRQTSSLEIPGEDPTLSELADHIRQTVLASQRLSENTEFSLSLNGKDAIPVNGQTLSSCSIVSGDLISVLLPEHVDTVSSSFSPFTETICNTAAEQIETQHKTAMPNNEPSCSSSAVCRDESQQNHVNPEQKITSLEPMLCSETEDGQAPLSLELLYHEAHCQSPSDSIMVAVHQLMLETGFIHESNEPNSENLLSGWRGSSGVYKLKYTHALCENSIITLAAVCTGPTLVINATFKINDTTNAVGKLCCLDPSIYVTSSWPGDNAAAVFRDLKKLSRIFKDQLAYPLIATARQAMDLPVVFGLAALPPELLLRVFRLLDVRSLIKLSAVSKHFHCTTSDSTLWKHLFLRDFRDNTNARSQPRDTDWRELYKRHYKYRSERQRLIYRQTFPSFPNSQGIFGQPIFEPIPVPGIIGGIYDQRPALPRVPLLRPRYDPIGPFQRHTPRSGGRDKGFI